MFAIPINIDPEKLKEAGKKSKSKKKGASRGSKADRTKSKE